MFTFRISRIFVIALGLIACSKMNSVSAAIPAKDIEGAKTAFNTFKQICNRNNADSFQAYYSMRKNNIDDFFKKPSLQSTDLEKILKELDTFSTRMQGCDYKSTGTKPSPREISSKKGSIQNAIKTFIKVIKNILQKNLNDTTTTAAANTQQLQQNNETTPTTQQSSVQQGALQTSGGPDSNQQMQQQTSQQGSANGDQQMPSQQDLASMMQQGGANGGQQMPPQQDEPTVTIATLKAAIQGFSANSIKTSELMQIIHKQDSTYAQEQLINKTDITETLSAITTPTIKVSELMSKLIPMPDMQGAPQAGSGPTGGQKMPSQQDEPTVTIATLKAAIQGFSANSIKKSDLMQIIHKQNSTYAQEQLINKTDITETLSAITTPTIKVSELMSKLIPMPDMQGAPQAGGNTGPTGGQKMPSQQDLASMMQQMSQQGGANGGNSKSGMPQ